MEPYGMTLLWVALTLILELPFRKVSKQLFLIVPIGLRMLQPILS